MKRAFVITIVFMFALFLLNSLSLAEEAQKKPDEKAKVETKVEVYKMLKESDKEIGKERENEELEGEKEEYENDEGAVYRELFEMIRRQNDQIQQLKEEIMRLRRLIEGRLQPQVRRGEGEQQPMNMESEIRMLEEKVRREPDNVDAHMRLGELYRQKGNINGAINQYEMVTKIRPDFDPPYSALERLRNQRKEREVQPKGEFNMGEVISSNMEYVTIKTFEGKTVAFRVPRVKKDDGSWGPPKMDIPEKGARVKISWNGVEGQKVIRRIEFLEKERREEAKPMEEYCMGEVISSNMEAVTIKTLENGEILTFRVPRVKKDDGSWVLNMDIAERAKSLDKGAKVKIFWNRVEDQRVLRRIEFLNREGQGKEARLSEDFVGEVISSNMEEIIVKNSEGNTVAFRVPRVKKDDGSLVPKIDIPEKGARVKILWRGIEGQKVITRIEFLNRERQEKEARPMEDFNVGEVITSGVESITIKTLEGETVTFKVPKVKKDDGAWVPNKEIGDKVSSLDKGKKVKIFWNKVEGEKIIKRIE